MAFGLSAPAFAATSTTTGAEAWHQSSKHIIVKDTLCDSHPVLQQPFMLRPAVM
jgi:hypothetical protein